VVYWTRRAFLALLAVVVLAMGVGALTRDEWGKAASLLVAAVVIVTPAIVTQWYITREDSKLSHPHSESN
jgi:hypothetical protein